MSDFLKDIIKTTGNEYAALVADGIASQILSIEQSGNLNKQVSEITRW